MAFLVFVGAPGGSFDGEDAGTSGLSLPDN